MSPSTELANTEMILLAMVLAGAGDQFVDVENIGLEAFRLSPQRFGWRTKPYPSDKIVVQTIADLEARHQDRLTLRGADKIATRMLTAEGRKAALLVGAKVVGRSFPDVAALVSHFRAPHTAPPEPIPAERRRVQSELGELRRHEAFQAWLDDKSSLSSLDRWQLLDAVSCLPDAPAPTIRDQVEKLAALAERWQDTEITEFLQELEPAIAIAGTRQSS